MRPYSPGGMLKALTAPLKSKLPNGWHSSFTAWTTRVSNPVCSHAFVPQRQYRASEPPSPLVFLRISTNFTSTLAVPLTSPELKIFSIKGSSGVELQDFTPDLKTRLRTLYAQ